MARPSRTGLIHLELADHLRSECDGVMAAKQADPVRMTGLGGMEKYQAVASHVDGCLLRYVGAQGWDPGARMRMKEGAELVVEA